jgi:hypothetical protein
LERSPARGNEFGGSFAFRAPVFIFRPVCFQGGGQPVRPAVPANSGRAHFSFFQFADGRGLVQVV